jgi:hypothetical protein
MLSADPRPARELLRLAFEPVVSPLAAAFCVRFDFEACRFAFVSPVSLPVAIDPLDMEPVLAPACAPPVWVPRWPELIEPLVALLSRDWLVLGVADGLPSVLWPDIEPVVAAPPVVERLFICVLVALLSRVLLEFGVEVCAMTGSAAATRAATATLPRSFFIGFPFWLSG